MRRYVDAVNSRDFDAMSDMLHDDFSFIDSRGYRISGRENCIAAHKAFFELEDSFSFHIDNYTMRDDLVLMRGHSKARDPRLASARLWTARVRDGKMLFWQNFGDQKSPALAHLLMPEEASRELTELSF
ncbi:nuclear transport factor 2 family protein [Aurantiacibacter sp. MUD11]|uniref:nuclear transport factor 2 family protein n=1 Tax=Aurantiacibacter sp. MUD11 TaxID=3003265 RepID=UPI0022AAEDA6|nr:nuclear transport factor 2 family protein [Aurantiacibacter sp. MUD11]WAT18873.1 nuclear transport factor 2 family protein [Aurantiacibacter sp. MUD11]